jgi:uncharacterized SAM-binding protein YcdF (DUF218 family)
MLRARGLNACVLVTSDLHMRRAIEAFRHEGLEAVPAPAPDPVGTPQRPLRAWLPTTQGLEYSQQIVHEYVGLFWYFVRGWT